MFEESISRISLAISTGITGMHLLGVSWSTLHPEALQGFEARLSARELCVGSDGATVVLGKERRNELQGQWNQELPRTAKNCQDLLNDLFEGQNIWEQKHTITINNIQ